jgi:hypothetical protein
VEVNSVSVDYELTGTGWAKATFSRERDGTIRLRIGWQRDETRPREQAKRLLDATVPLDDLAAAVAGAVRSLERVHGAAGYRKKWVHHDLPLALASEIERRLGRTGGGR